MMEVKRYIVIKDDIVIGDYITSQGEKGVIASVAGTVYDSIKEIDPSSPEVFNKKNINEFDKDYKLKPLSERVRCGYVDIPARFILEGESIRPMTLDELVKAGHEKVPPRMKVSDNMFIPMTDEEIIKSGQATKEQLDSEKQIIKDEELIQKEMRAIAIERLGNKLKVLKQ